MEPPSAQGALKAQRVLHTSLHNNRGCPGQLDRYLPGPTLHRGATKELWALPPSAWWFMTPGLEPSKDTLLDALWPLYGYGDFQKGKQKRAGAWDCSLETFVDSCKKLLMHLASLVEEPQPLLAAAPWADDAAGWQLFTQPLCILHHCYEPRLAPRAAVQPRQQQGSADEPEMFLASLPNAFGASPCCMRAKLQCTREADAYPQQVWLGRWEVTVIGEGGKRKREACFDSHVPASRLLLWLLLGPPPGEYQYEGLVADMQEGGMLKGRLWVKQEMEHMGNEPYLPVLWQDMLRMQSGYQAPHMKCWEEESAKGGAGEAATEEDKGRLDHGDWHAMHLCVDCRNCLNPWHLVWGLPWENRACSRKIPQGMEESMEWKGRDEPCFRAIAYRDRVLKGQWERVGV